MVGPSMGMAGLAAAPMDLGDLYVFTSELLAFVMEHGHAGMGGPFVGGFVGDSHYLPHVPGRWSGRGCFF